MQGPNSEELRLALSQFATGVTIVTTMSLDVVPVGVTANSFNSVSLEPPMVLWSLANSAYSRNAFERATHFCVHVLADSQEELSRRFAMQGADKFAGLAWNRGQGSVPMIEGCVARFQCRRTNQIPVGDHVVFVGEVLEFDLSDRRPLVFHGGRYALAERRRIAELAQGLGDSDSFPQDRRSGRKPPA